MTDSRERIYLSIFILILLLVVGLPYLYAWQAGGETHVFGGFFINYQDGQSYLAKMRQGYMGRWTFTLPYTAEPGEGTFLHMFYLFWGHMARILNLPLLLTLHLSRILGAVILSLVLFQFSGYMFEQPWQRWTAFLLASLGSGLGWLGLPFGLLTADFSVPEAFPFSTLYAYSHLSFGMAIQLWLMMKITTRKLTWLFGLQLIVLGILIALISPFALTVVFFVISAVIAWRFFLREDWQSVFWNTVVLGIASGPIMVYYLWLTYSHPVLANWSAQNLTISPPAWDVLLALSPALLLGFWGAWLVLKQRSAQKQLLPIWLLSCLLLVYIPFSLQRRFLMGLYIPAAFLAVVAITWLVERYQRAKRIVLIALFTLSSITNLLILLISVSAVQNLEPLAYFSADELQAVRWLESQEQNNAIVISSPEVALIIPVYSDARVVYAHPYETVDAEVQEGKVEDFFSGGVSASRADAFFDQNQITFVFYGPREKEMGQIPWLADYPIAFQGGDVLLYQVGP